MQRSRPVLALGLAGLTGLVLLAVPWLSRPEPAPQGPARAFDAPRSTATPAGVAGGATVVHEGREIVRGEALLELESWAELARIEARLKRLGARVVGALPAERLLRVRFDGRADARTAFARFAKLAGVAAVEGNAVGRGGALTPDDTFFARQWHLANTGQTGGKPGADLGAPAAWAIQQGDAGVVCAVLDSGLDAAHPEFAGRTLPGWDFVDEDPDPSPDHPHGIWVAALLGATTDNSFGVAGVDRRCRLVAFKVLDAANSGTTFDLVQALDRCVSLGVDVACLALVDYPGTRALKRALKRARNAGVILVACAGNGGPGDADDSWPGASPHALSIGFTDANDARHPASATGNALDFVAPGVSLVTAADSGLNSYASFTGCSAATPVAAGLVALLKAEAPDLTPDEARLWLEAGAADRVGAPGEDLLGWDPFHGAGRLSAARSLSALCSCAGGEDLRASPPSLSVVAGGRQILRLEAGAQHAGRRYWLFGSHSGTAPGVAVHGLVLPLVWDGYLDQTLLAPNTAPLFGSLGYLDAAGRARAEFRVPVGTSTALAGLRLWHAYLVFEGATAVHASRAVALELR